MDSFHLSIITPERVFFEGSVTYVGVPGTLGEFGVLPGHMPFVSTLKAGVITVEELHGGKQRIVTLDGIAQVNPERCIILSETARALDTITRTELEAELVKARAAADTAVTDEQQKIADRTVQILEMIQTEL